MSAVTPITDKLLRRGDCPLCANRRQTDRSKPPLYSITSSANATNVFGTLRFIALAVFRLNTNR